MTHLRRILAPVTAVWLMCQVGTGALVPVASWITAAERHAAECTCGHGADAMCPMHHKPAGGAAPCAMHAANRSGTAVLSALGGITGLVAERTYSLRPPEPSEYARGADAGVVGERPIPPDPPPPRA